MAAKRQEDFNSRPRGEEEQTEAKTKYSQEAGEDYRDDRAEAHKLSPTLENLAGLLEGQNAETAAAFRDRRNLMEFTQEERVNHLDNLASAIHGNPDWSLEEKEQACREATDHVFHHQMQAMEERVTDFSNRFSDKLWDALKEAGIDRKYCRFVETADGDVQLRFKVMSASEARKIAKASGCKVFMDRDDNTKAWLSEGTRAETSEAEALEDLMYFHKDSFLKSLYNPRSMEGFTVESMNQALEGAADTGSTYTALQRDTLQALGVQVQDSVESRLADGSIQVVEIGQATIRLGGREFSTTVIFGEQGEPNLLGIIALEEALLAVDPVSNELIPVIAKRY